MSQANDIRTFIVRHYFEEARKQGQKQITIVSGDVQSRMGLKDRMPNVCQVLRGEKLSKLGHVRLIEEISKLGVKKDSSTNKFVFELLQCIKEG